MNSGGPAGLNHASTLTNVTPLTQHHRRAPVKTTEAGGNADGREAHEGDDICTRIADSPVQPNQGNVIKQSHSK